MTASQTNSETAEIFVTHPTTGMTGYGISRWTDTVTLRFPDNVILKLTTTSRPSSK